MKQKLLNVCGVCFLSSLVILFLLPLQTYLINQEYFTYEPFRIIVELSLLSFLIAILGSVFLLVVPGGVRKWCNVLIVVGTICSYVEVQFLSAGLPPLDGDTSLFWNHGWMLIDGIILAAIAGVLLLSHTFVFKYSLMILSGLSILGIASLFDVKKAERVEPDTPFNAGWCLKSHAVESVRFSKKKNVFMFIIDSTPATLTADLLQTEPNLRNMFPGFIAFRNNIGMSEPTYRGLPATLTGKYVQKEDNMYDYEMSMFGTNSLLHTYLKSDYAMYVRFALWHYGFTNRNLFEEQEEISRIEYKQHRVKLLERTAEIPHLNLYEIARFRMLPYALKMNSLTRADRAKDKDLVKNVGNVYYGSDKQLFGMMEKCCKQPFVDESVFCAFHTDGTHVPVTFDRYGNKLVQPRRDVRAVSEASYYILSLLGDFLKALQNAGLYDKSFIVITADHGHTILRQQNGTGHHSVILMVKPCNSFGSCDISDAPTTSANLSNLMKAEAMNELSIADVINELRAELRIYRGRPSRYSANIYDWVYDADGKVIDVKNRGIFSD